MTAPRWVTTIAVVSLLIDGHFDYVGSILIAPGDIALVMLLCKSNALEELKARPAAVGRMALSN
jgi:uncharacterized membrane protein YeiB